MLPVSPAVGWAICTARETGAGLPCAGLGDSQGQPPEHQPCLEWSDLGVREVSTQGPAGADEVLDRWVGELSLFIHSFPILKDLVRRPSHLS